ncbi:hypothetical protein KP509_32G054700 [Ceratopteris richardii]|nr:hypothetical protein KP509_32G054700 [Ceratopteris richardii]
MEALAALQLPGISSSHCVLQNKVIHNHLVKHGLETEVFLINNLISIYLSLGMLSEASQVFNSAPKRNVVSWTILISYEAQHGCSKVAFAYFHRMQEDGIKPNKVTIISLLSACCNPEFRQRGSLLHVFLVEDGYETHMVAGTALVRMYCNCSTLENAYRLFIALEEKDNMSWAILISAHVQHEYGDNAILLYKQMLQEGTLPNNYIYNKVFNACSIIPDLSEGLKSHARIIGSQFEQCIYVNNALVDMYAKCRSLESAHKIFMNMPRKDLVSWNVIMTAFAQYGLGDLVFKHFNELKAIGLKPDEYTYSCLLTVCMSLEDISLGRSVHEEIRKAGLECRLPVANALLDMYSKSGCFEEAHRLFDKMRPRNNASEIGMGTRSVLFISSKQDHKLFSHGSGRDVFSWTALIQGYTQYGHHHDALDFFLDMQMEGVRPNHVTFGVAVNACAGLLDVEIGNIVHMSIIQDGYEDDVSIGNALIDMYARCGNLEDAHRVFSGMPNRDSVSWNVMIGSYAEHGKVMDAFNVSLEMESAGMGPDEFTFSCILTGCRHAGMVSDACHFFNHMIRYNHVTASAHHYASIIDLLGRAGQLHEAEDLVNRIPFQPNIVVFMSFLSACKSHSHIDLAHEFSDHMIGLAPTNVAAHVLLSNISNGGIRQLDTSLMEALDNSMR